MFEILSPSCSAAFGLLGRVLFTAKEVCTRPRRDPRHIQNYTFYKICRTYATPECLKGFRRLALRLFCCLGEDTLHLNKKCAHCHAETLAIQRITHFIRVGAPESLKCFRRLALLHFWLLGGEKCAHCHAETLTIREITHFIRLGI